MNDSRLKIQDSRCILIFGILLLGLVQPSFATTLIPTLTEEKIKEVEVYLTQAVNIGPPPGDYRLREKAHLTHLQLLIHKARQKEVLNLLKVHEPFKGIGAGRNEEGLIGLSALAMLYIDAYKMGEPGFKDKALQVLNEIRQRYYDEREGVFLLKVGGMDVVTAPATASTVIAFLKASQDLKDKDTLLIAKKALTYLDRNLTGKEGAFHIFMPAPDRFFQGPDRGMAFMDGQLIDNAWVGLSLLEGYRVFSELAYLNKAREIANFSIERLYDPRLGGFIQRNSNSPPLYQPGEELYIGERPFEENGVMALFYQSLYEVTGEKRYLDTSTGTLAYLMGYYSVIPLSEGIYAFKALLQYPEVTRQGKARLEWGEGLPVSGIVPLVILSFLAGVLSFLSPCTLPILPAYFAFTFQGGRGRILTMTLAFFLGLALVFSLLGATASFIGSFLRAHIMALRVIGGIALVCFGIMSMLGKGFSGAPIFQRHVSTTFLGSFVFGMAMAIGWSACVGPILAGILVLAASSEGLWRGVGLLFVYALGLGLPLISLSLVFHGLNKEGLFWRFLKGKGWEVKAFGRGFLIHSTSLISGLLFTLLGLLMVTGYLAALNRLIPLQAQVWFAGAEEWLAGVFK
ncbi:MAG: hypothetical protein HY878_06055 [Deltaproteobacteria bacterium]|nr:hypothetical protein [Deltaproteobacteria bacterium]